MKQKAETIFERDLAKYPKFSEKIKITGDKKEEEEKKNYPKYPDLLG